MSINNKVKKPIKYKGIDKIASVLNSIIKLNLIKQLFFTKLFKHFSLYGCLTIKNKPNNYTKLHINAKVLACK